VASRFVGHHSVLVLNNDGCVVGDRYYCGGERGERCRLNEREVRDFPMWKYVMHEQKNVGRNKRRGLVPLIARSESNVNGWVARVALGWPLRASIGFNQISTCAA
jgi:hypothetical protein